MTHLLKPKPMLTLLLAAFGAAGASAATPAALPAYGADPQQTSVSGLSSGAYMAVQLQVAYSASIIGAGIVAGGPYYCAAAGGLFFAGNCMGIVIAPALDPSLMVGAAKGFADTGLIDPLSNLRRSHVYVFSGTYDTVVYQRAVDATAAFFRQGGVTPANLNYVHTMSTGHALITPAYGSECAANMDPYINHCKVNDTGYDQAGAMLAHIYGALNPRVKTPTGKIVSFNQSTYASTAARMADTAYLYVPQSCNAAGAHCKVHVALHGCVQSAESVGNQFYTDTGYNNWADSNRMLVLYPQVNKSVDDVNPKGCWDWWGYTGADYAVKSSLQMKTIMAMVSRLEQPQ